MQLSFIFTTLMSFAAIAAAYPTPGLGMKRTSLTQREELDSNFTRYLNTRAPDDIPSGPQLDDPDTIDEPNFND
ncbi:hypothetical protein DEU56DRAFT_354617 [Suillus clintonianus]|uniref:uncharacterized protein n=1 Tax=Suillus clintonianus TaxID=1904413 RepID=UPI001B8808CE|nr:uncharacterized protein DEU56DRAFT_354617 [Suillus clintonianus]KAG2137060.1 hypothetical protein DEU56DRAFT_354617 [Suillus clintonianus]